MDFFSLNSFVAESNDKVFSAFLVIVLKSSKAFNAGLPDLVPTLCVRDLDKSVLICRFKFCSLQLTQKSGHFDSKITIFLFP
jgi:hypothetical protein